MLTNIRRIVQAMPLIHNYNNTHNTISFRATMLSATTKLIIGKQRGPLLFHVTLSSEQLDYFIAFNEITQYT